MTQFHSTAIAGTAYIVAEDGHFVIYVEVMFLEEIVRKRIHSYSSRQKAEVAARLMGYAVSRNLETSGLRVKYNHD